MGSDLRSEHGREDPSRRRDSIIAWPRGSHVNVTASRLVVLPSRSALVVDNSITAVASINHEETNR